MTPAVFCWWSVEISLATDLAVPGNDLVHALAPPLVHGLPTMALPARAALHEPGLLFSA